MAISVSGTASGDAVGSLYDSTVNETPARDVFGQAVSLRELVVDNTGVAAAVYCQVFDAANPTLGSAFATVCVKVAASAMAVVSVSGDGYTFGALTYVITDAPKGTALTGADRKLFAFGAELGA